MIPARRRRVQHPACIAALHAAPALRLRSPAIARPSSGASRMTAARVLPAALLTLAFCLPL
ncbi:MAG TPA: hypothetical protein PKC88_09025, partial [Plasticicumulans sp.]|nr:hypothetical protein [Plasticicumulans sp.]